MAEIPKYIRININTALKPWHFGAWQIPGSNHGQNRSTQGSQAHPDPGPTASAVADAVRAIQALGVAVGPAREGPLPCIEETMPILAHRAARIGAGAEGPCLMSMIDTYRLDVDMYAECLRGARLFHEPHLSPDENCTCGFYSVPLADPVEYGQWHVDLLVELSGKVLVCGPDATGPAGYRAEHQRIIEVRIPRCGLCPRPAHVVAPRNVGGRSRCERHAPDPPGWWLTRDDLARALPVPVTYLGE